jgi:hypothetical protein
METIVPEIGEIVNFYSAEAVIRKGHLQNPSVFFPYSGKSRKTFEKSQ